MGIGNFFVTFLVARLVHLVGEDYRTPPLFVGPAIVTRSETMESYRTGLLLLAATEPGLLKVHPARPRHELATRAYRTQVTQDGDTKAS